MASCPLYYIPTAGQMRERWAAQQARWRSGQSIENQLSCAFGLGTIDTLREGRTSTRAGGGSLHNGERATGDTTTA